MIKLLKLIKQFQKHVETIRDFLTAPMYHSFCLFVSLALHSRKPPFLF